MNVLLSRTEASVLNSTLNKTTTWDYDNLDASGDNPTAYNENPKGLLRQFVEQGYTRNSSGANVAYTYTTAYTYNAKGLVTKIAGPRTPSGYKTTFTYHSGTYDLKTVTRPLIGDTEFPLAGYDAAGFPGQATDVNGHNLTFVYDGRGRVTEAHYAADGSVRSVAYNLGGEVTNTVDEDGAKRGYTYDTTYGRLFKIIEYLGSTPRDSVVFSRNAQGNITNAQWVDDETDKVTRVKNWSYQHPTYPGLLWKEIEPATSDHANTATTQYDYYASGVPSQKTDGAGLVTTYEYDVFNRLAAMTQPMSAITRFDYDSQGNLTYVQDAAGKINTYVYDDMGRLVSSTTPDTGTTTYGYDFGGNLVRKTDALGVRVTYVYDLLDRLTSASYPALGDLDAYAVSYTYDEGTDGIGHLTTVLDPSG